MARARRTRTLAELQPESYCQLRRCRRGHTRDASAAAARRCTARGVQHRTLVSCDTLAAMVVVGIAKDAESVGMCPERLAQVKALCRGYVDRGEKAFTQVLVARAGKIVLEDSYGMADVDAQTPVADDAIVRIYSMTKPITCVAALMCYEQNCFR